jgi:hypothetical protein
LLERTGFSVIPSSIFSLSHDRNPRKRIEGYKGRPLVMRLIRPAWLDEGHEDEAEAKLKRRQGETRDLYKDQER